MPHPYIAIASDHAGIELKSLVKRSLSQFQWKDFGTETSDSVDYPDFAEKAARAIIRQEAELAVLICGSGVGMAIAANKINGIRATLAESVETAKLSRQHNDANVLCVGSRIVSSTLALEIIQTFLTTVFSGEARHQNRIDKIMKLEE